MKGNMLNVVDCLSEEYATPWDLGVHTILVVLCTPRSGSSFLCDLLQTNPGFGKPDEWLHDYNVPVFMEKAGVEDLKSGLNAYLRAVFRAGIKDGVCGIKLMLRPIIHVLDLAGMWTELSYEKRIQRFLKTYLPGAKFIFLTREDEIDQAISYDKAIQSGMWHSNNESRRSEADLICSPPILEFVMKSFREEEETLRRALDGIEAEQLNITYEKMVSNLEGVLGDIEQLMNMDAPVNWLFNKTRDPVKTPINAVWKKVYLETREAGAFNNEQSSPNETLPGAPLWVEIANLDAAEDRIHVDLWLLNMGEEPLCFREDEGRRPGRICLVKYPYKLIVQRIVIASAVLPDQLEANETCTVRLDVSRWDVQDKGDYYFIPIIDNDSWIRLMGATTPQLELSALF